jgi:hypothetical protein
MKKLLSVIVMISFAALLIWLIKSKAVQSVLMFVLVAIVLVVAVLACYLIGVMIFDSGEKERKSIHPIVDFLGRFLIGGFVLYSFFEIVRISGCNAGADI